MGPYMARRSNLPDELECSRFGGKRNLRIMSKGILVVMYSNSGGLSGIGNKKISLSLLAALSSSEPWNPFLIKSVPKMALRLSAFSVLASSGFLSPRSAFHLTTGDSSVTSSLFSSLGSARTVL
jgi:hypothetical protein